MPLAKYKPVTMLPILNRPFIEYTVTGLKELGVADVMIAGSRGIRGSYHYKDFLNSVKAKTWNVHYVEDERPRGTAGVLRDLEGYINNDPFLVVNANCFLGGIDLEAVVDFHIGKKAALTIVAKRTRNFSPEGVRCSPDGMVEEFIRIHASRERRSSIEPVGIYVFSPEALDFIDSRSYFDIKEQLIPALRKASLPVYLYETKDLCKPLYTVKDYFDLHRALLCHNYPVTIADDTTMIADGIWVGENVSISPNAYILPPVVIGSNTVLESHSQVIGPACIGQRCMLEEGSLVRESILWDDTVMERGARVHYSIMESGLRATAGETFSSTVLVEEAEVEETSLVASDHVFYGVTAMNPSILMSQKRRIYLWFKRLMDFSCSGLGLLCISPLLLLIALIIKMDSKGPVFYRQKRCGRGGTDFGMIKFRTMIPNADKQQDLLAARKSTDGPMFKLMQDPRVTRIGAFLRRTSLDELPQLINVFKGEMSLVGPRPLVMNEMKCSPSWRDIRLRVKPGITGLWQVSGRSEAQFHDWIRYDVHYVMNQSLLLDLQILLKTVKVVLKKVGAY